MASHIKRTPLSFFLLFLFISLLLSSCHVVRYAWWNYADADDYRKFPADTVWNGPDQHPLVRRLLPADPPLPPAFTCDEAKTLDSFLSGTKTLAFLVLRHDTVVMERYFRGTAPGSTLTSFSVAKSFVGALVGIALAEGSIKRLDQPVTDFLPEMKDSGFSRVTVGDLLAMRSGVRFDEGYSSPFSEMAKFYYGKNLRRYTLKLQVTEEPGERYDYISGNTQILAMVLERATGKRLPEYLEEMIWKPAGMEAPASWNMDSKRHADTKAFCCINARAADFARFGQLFLDSGKVAGRPVIPAGWVEKTLHLENDSRDSQGYPYTYAWRVTPEKNLFAKGILGQYIFICPSKNIVIVRFGETAGDLVWPEFFRQLVESL